MSTYGLECPLRLLGRTDLLGLHRDLDYWNPPRDAQPGTPAVEAERTATSEDSTEAGVEEEKG